MDTRNIITGILSRVFDDSYIHSLRKEYEDQVEAGTFRTEETEYTLASKYLKDHLPAERIELLSCMESHYADKYHYASTYPLYCGLMCAFEQFFLPEREQVYSFSSCVEEDMNMLPRMQRHHNYYESNASILELSNKLHEGADEETSEHITSINCGWDQRVHSAAVDSFYIGYRLGIDIIDRVVPMGSTRLVPKMLYLEYELGFTTPYRFREQRETKVNA